MKNIKKNNFRTFKDSEISKKVNSLGLSGTKSHNHKDLIPCKVTDLSLLNTINNLNPLGRSIDDFYRLNSDGLRCDEFKDDHDGLHILFAGCSNTFGDGTPLELLWSYKLYRAISEEYKTSGYYNIAVSGLDSLNILVQIRKYLDLYGNPDIIFINIPDRPRDPVFKQTYIDPDGSKNYFEYPINNFVINFYELLSFYCETNNIELYSFSYDPLANFDLSLDDYRQKFSNYYRYSVEDMSKHILKFESENLNTEYGDFITTALDDDHPGSAYQDFYYSFMRDVFFNNTKIDRLHI